MDDVAQWLKVLPIVQFAVNSLPNRMTGYSAHYLTYGYQPMSPLQLLEDRTQSKPEFVNKFVQCMKQVMTSATHNAKKAYDDMKHVAN